MRRRYEEPTWQEKLKNKNFHYSALATVSYTGSGCIEDCYYICRCSRITSTRASEINTFEGKREILKLIEDPEDSPLTKYCIDRAVSAVLKRGVSLNIPIVGGYYGEEIGRVTLNEMPDIIRAIEEVKDSESPLEAALIIEYGYLLPSLAGKTWETRTLKTKDVDAPNLDYQNKLDPVAIERYENWTLPRGVVLEQGDRYRLVDGYHRYTAALRFGVEKSEYVVGK